MVQLCPVGRLVGVQVVVFLAGGRSGRALIHSFRMILVRPLLQETVSSEVILWAV